MSPSICTKCGADNTGRRGLCWICKKPLHLPAQAVPRAEPTPRQPMPQNPKPQQPLPRQPLPIKRYTAQARVSRDSNRITTPLLALLLLGLAVGLYSVNTTMSYALAAIVILVYSASYPDNKKLAQSETSNRTDFRIISFGLIISAAVLGGVGYVFWLVCLSKPFFG